MEYWDILDENGNKTGRTVKRGAPMSRGEYHLVVDIWIRNSKGEYLISKRTPTKFPEPGKWSPTCGNAVTGDDSITAALRETKEELGITLDPTGGRKIKTYKVGINTIVDVWLFHREVDLNTIVLQAEEADGVMWAAPEAIKRMIKNGEFISTFRMPYIDMLF